MSRRKRKSRKNKVANKNGIVVQNNNVKSGDISAQIFNFTAEEYETIMKAFELFIRAVESEKGGEKSGKN